MVTKKRSPNYPSIDLNAAIERTKLLYRKVQRGEFTAKDAAEGWGYSSVSGPVRRIVGAVRQYGLLEQKKGDNAKLTNRALTIVLRSPATREYQTAVREAALEPPLFRELYESGRQTAATDALRQYLVVEKDFTDDGATRLIEVLRATMTLAQLADTGIMTRRDEDIIEQEGEEEMQMPPPPPPGTTERMISLPITTTKWVNLCGPFPVTSTEWEQLKAVLEAMKPGLVQEEMQPVSGQTEQTNESVEEKPDA